MTEIKNRTDLTFPDFTEETEQKVVAIVRGALDERFPTGFTFDPIYVEPRVYFGYERALHIYVVYDGDYDLLDPDWTSTMLLHLQPQLDTLGLPYFFNKSFVEKSEWEEIQQGIVW